jgi:hypothetical protein
MVKYNTKVTTELGNTMVELEETFWWIRRVCKLESRGSMVDGSNAI